METSLNSSIYESLRWYLGKEDVDADARRVNEGRPLALVGSVHEDLDGFADRIAPERPVLDLGDRTPTAPTVKRLFDEHPDAIVLAPRAEDVIGAIGLIVQPWYMAVSPLSSRSHEAMRLLREAIAQLGVRTPLEVLGTEIVLGLAEYSWPKGLREIREAAHRFGAYLQAGNLSAGARAMSVSRQAFSKYLQRRIAL